MAEFLASPVAGIWALALVMVLFAVLVQQTILFHVEQRRLRAENKDLLNRLMSRNFGEYAAGSRVAPATHASLRDYLPDGGPAAVSEEEEKNDGLGIPVS